MNGQATILADSHTQIWDDLSRVAGGGNPGAANGGTSGFLRGESGWRLCVERQHGRFGREHGCGWYAAIREAAQAAYQPAKPLDNTDFAMNWRKEMARYYVAGTLRELASWP